MIRFKKKYLKLLISIAVLIAVFPVNIYISDHEIEIKEYTVKLSRLPAEFNGFTILQLTDNHLKSSSDVELNKKFINTAETKLSKEGKKIDCVVITGDLLEFSDDVLPKGTMDMLAELTKSYPVYYVDGNHDGYKENNAKYSNVGVRVLDNESIKLYKGSSKIWITGISDPIHKQDDEDTAFKNVAANEFNLVLIHAPSKFKELSDYGADLILCGHTHAGQISIPFLPVLYAPGQGIFPKYGYGFYTERRQDGGETVMYVSKGIGHTYPLDFRFFNRPELAVFTLEKK